MKQHIIMSNKEANRIAVLNKLLDGVINQKQVAGQLGISTRQVRRLKKRYQKEGVAGLAHKNRGRVSNHKIQTEETDKAIKLIRKHYFDFGPTLAHEKLVEYHGIDFGVDTLRKTMIEVGIWKPKRRKSPRIHQLRTRRECEGELVQIDGSPHHWLENRGPYCDLLLYVDDATSKIKWAELFPGETTKAYFSASKGYLKKYGKPLAYYCDKNSIFRINTKKGASFSTTNSHGFTQFGRAMKNLDIGLIFAHSAQAKGRVERANLTLQDRLVKELRLQGIGSIQEANAFLPSFVGKFNSKFSVQPKQKADIHRPLLPTDDLEKILCFRNIRVLSRNLTCQYKNKLYQIKTKRSVYAMRHAPVLIVENLKGEISIEYKDCCLDYSLLKRQPPADIVDTKQLNSVVDKIKQTRIPWKPTEDHPWRHFTI